MAIDLETARLFLACRAAGIVPDRFLMLGRQNYLPKPSETRQLFAEFRVDPDAALLADASGNPPFSEPFFKSLGVRHVDSMDVASYEGATILHDLNLPLPDQALVEKFDMVFDGGTLEHVFHFPQAILNAMRMVRVGGWYAGFTPGNNWFGHGFYQFSPEVYYRALSPQNGFSCCAVFIIPEDLSMNWYLAGDPAHLGTRTNLINAVRSPMLVLARKSQPTPAALSLQQSDYQPFWDKDKPVLNTGKTLQEGGLTRSLKSFLYQRLPGLTHRLATLEARPWRKEYSVKRPEVFAPVDKSRLPDFLQNLQRSDSKK